MYQIVTEVTSDIDVPSTYLVLKVFIASLEATHQTQFLWNWKFTMFWVNWILHRFPCFWVLCMFIIWLINRYLHNTIKKFTWNDKAFVHIIRSLHYCILFDISYTCGNEYASLVSSVDSSLPYIGLATVIYMYIKLHLLEISYKLRITVFCTSS